MTQPYGSGATFDNGRYRADRIVRGDPVHGLYEGVRTTDNRAVLITLRSRDWDRMELEPFQLRTAGVASLLFVGPPDVYQRPKIKTTGGTLGAMIEARPLGSTLDAHWGRLHEREVVRIGLGLVATVAAAAGAQPILGIRPELTYVEAGGDGLRFCGVAPRSIRILSHHHDGYARAFEHGFSAPEVPVWMPGDASPTSDLFSAALTMWAAFTGAHAYRVTPNDIDEDVMARDDRGPFPGSSELGRILEPILRADVASRPSVAETLRELGGLADMWGVSVPPFPPDGLSG